MKNIIFDFDGPLFDSRTIAKDTLQDVFNKLQIPIVVDFDGLSLSSPEKMVTACVEKYDLYNIDASRVFEIYYQELKNNEAMAKARCNIIGILEQLKLKNYRLFVVSDRSEKRLKKIMKNMKILSFFEDVIGRERYGLKPLQGSAAYLKEKFEVFPKDTWMIGDTENDYLYAKEAGYYYAQVIYSLEPTTVSEEMFDLILKTEEDILKI